MTETALFTPVTLITGFLGSGKTTLLQRLLADPQLADTAVLINEFGEVGLDHHLLERIDERTVLLQSGCLCCTVRGELSDAVRDLHSRRTRGQVPDFRRLVIESTGLADPFPVLTTFQADPVLKHHFRMAGVVATVDAVNGARQLATHPESVKQVAVADQIAITKTDLVPATAADAVVRRVRAINPDAVLLHAHEAGNLAATLLPDDGHAAFDRRDAATQDWIAQEMRLAASETEGSSRHSGDIHAFALTFDEPLEWTGFGIWLTMLLNRHGNEVLRVKGILDIAGTDAPVAIHGVQHLVHAPVHLRAWPDRVRRSRIVFIVKGLERVSLERSLRAFAGLGGAAPGVAA
jgi:G3E family GTPase